MRMERWIRASIGLGALAIVAMLVGHLALTDIHHGEADVSLEWSVLRLCFAVILVALVVSMATLVRVARKKA
jgi:hypothetical protein